MEVTIDLIDRHSLLNELNDKFQSIAEINAVVIEQPTVEAIPTPEVRKILRDCTNEVTDSVLEIIRKEYIPKADYETRLKADMAAMLDKIKEDFIARYPRNYAGELELGGRSCVFSLNDILHTIDKYKAVLTVTPQESKTGHWIDINGIYAECSNCNEEIYMTGNFKYCPNCGARMLKPQESEGSDVC